MKHFRIIIDGTTDDDVPDAWLHAMAACAEVQVVEPEIFTDADPNPTRFTVRDVSTDVRIKLHRTSQASPRCTGSGVAVNYNSPHIIDCPECGRPVRPMAAGLSIAYKNVPSHGTARTRNTDAHDARLREMQRYEQEHKQRKVLPA